MLVDKCIFIQTSETADENRQQQGWWDTVRFGNSSKHMSSMPVKKGKRTISWLLFTSPFLGKHGTIHHEVLFMMSPQLWAFFSGTVGLRFLQKRWFVVYFRKCGLFFHGTTETSMDRIWGLQVI